MFLISYHICNKCNDQCFAKQKSSRFSAEKNRWFLVKVVTCLGNSSVCYRKWWADHPSNLLSSHNDY